jgi:hypothetical protein
MMMRRTVVSALSTLLAAASLTLSAYAQSSTAFTYQGFLKDNNNPANGTYDLKFTLYDAATEGNAIGNPVFIEDLQISGGLFTVEVDFGTAPFAQGQRRWIEIAVRPGDSTDDHTTLDPRIELTPVPYAIYAQNVANNAVTNTQLANDPASLSKVSGGALSIENGHLKRANNVYFYATGLKTFGTYNGIMYYLLPERQRNRYDQWVPLAFDRIISNIGGGSYTAVDNPNNPTQTIGEYTVPVSGYYMISANVSIQSWDIDGDWNDIIINGTVALQRQVSNNNWEILGAYYSIVSQTDGLPIHGVFYLNQGDKIRVAAYNRPSYTNKLLALRGPSAYAYTPFARENHHLTIYLLSAADRPSN